jgi:hypothetical protein
MAVLISDRDELWREYHRTTKFLISIWRIIYENKIRLRLSGLLKKQNAICPAVGRRAADVYRTHRLQHLPEVNLDAR